MTDFQSRALLHIAAADPGLPMPRLLRPISGDAPDANWTVPGMPPRRVRLLTYLAGRPLHLLTPTPSLRRDLGACLARLSLALRDFSHPSQSHRLLWDLQHAAEVRGLLAALPPGRRALPERYLDRFATYALPVLPGLRAQVIHNDFNPHNILADPVTDTKIAGIIDFGDMVHAPLVQDLATAAAYQITPDGPVLQGPAEMIAAFHAICPLLPAEIMVLPDLIAARLALTITISSWRASRHPDNADYIMRNQKAAWTGLERFEEQTRDAAVAFIRKHCTNGEPA
ncbi:MAG: phosphotransferase [Acetobacteraceae bacterium]